MTSEPTYDLRAFFRKVGSFSGERVLTSAPIERPGVEFEVELLDEPVARKVDDIPLTPGGFIDGVQAALLVTYRGHRPVYLNYVTAGCLGPDGQIKLVREELFASGSSADADWFHDLGSAIPWEPLDAQRPDEVAPSAAKLLGTRRDSAERRLVADLVESGAQHLIVDGHLAGRTDSTALLGVVKTSRTRYLPDESLLWGMPQGFMSPRFKLPAGHLGCARDRYSCYLRLHDATRQAWDFGLVRLESYSPDDLESLAAMALQERQSSRSRDSRFDRHLAGVRAVEDALRARRPDVFAL